jgi:hypothetical protein
MVSGSTAERLAYRPNEGRCDPVAARHGAGGADVMTNRCERCGGRYLPSLDGECPASSAGTHRWRASRDRSTEDGKRGASAAQFESRRPEGTHVLATVLVVLQAAAVVVMAALFALEIQGASLTVLGRPLSLPMLELISS